MYLGSHAQADGIENMIQAMRIIKDQNDKPLIKLRLIGDGPLKASLQALVQQLGLSDVSFENPVAKNLIPKIALQADAFIVVVLNFPKLYRYGISMNKLYDYLASARPIVIASNAANNPVVEANAGIAIETANPEYLAAAILQLVKMSDPEREQLGRNGRNYVQDNHSFELLSRKFAAVLDDVCES